MPDVMIYMFDLVTGEYKSARPAQFRPNGQPITDVCGGTPVAPPDVPDGHVACWTGTCWEMLEDHRQKMDERGRKYGGTAYWMPSEGDDWRSSARYMEELGPLPDGAVTEQPEKPAPTLEERAAAIDAETSAAILAGFDYEVNGETLHFSYDTFDQQNFADTASACLLSKSGAQGIPEAVTWNAYRAGGEMVRLTLTADEFMALYVGGALAHKAAKMENGGARKAALEVTA